MKVKQIKRVCATNIQENGKCYQFITSGYPNRRKDGTEFSSVDGMFGFDFISNLDYDECDMEGQTNQGIECYLHISETPQEGYRQVWCYGADNSPHAPEYITQFKPERIMRTKNGMSAVIKNGCLRLDSFNRHTYFNNKPSKFCFPVYMKVERVNNN